MKRIFFGTIILSALLLVFSSCGTRNARKAAGALSDSLNTVLEMENKMKGKEAMSKEEKQACIDAISKKITEISGKVIKVC